MGFWKKIQKLQVKDLNINNKNSSVREELREIDKHVFQPTWDQLGGLLVDPVAKAYIEFVEEQAKGKYQPLPQWLKLILSENNSYDIDLPRVSYAEGHQHAPSRQRHHIWLQYPLPAWDRSRA
jgi:hypothetical protein